MGDDGAMDLLEVLDEAFAGCVDPRELISKMNDPSEVHVMGLLKVRKKKLTKEQRQKRQAQVGLASNIVGLAAGTTALAAAAKDSRFAEGGRVSRAIARAGEKLPSVTPKTGKAGAYTAGGALALQAANTGGDIVANRVLDREARKKVKKSLDMIVSARRFGAIDNETAAQMGAEVIAEYEELTKGFVRGVAMGRAAAKATRQRDLERQVDEVIPKGKKLLAGLGLAAAGGTGVAVGATGQKKLSARKTQQVALAKREDVADVEWTGTISKRDDEKRMVFGWASVSKVNGVPVIDRQGDYVPIETTEDAAYTYMLHSRKGGDMHRRVAKFGIEDTPLHTADIIESMVFTPEKLEALGLAPDALPEAWWVGFKVHDDQQWADYKAGKRPSFSIHGSGKRVDAPELAHV